MAPVAASAADLNVAGVRQYTTSEEQVTSITQFSDVKPTDWAYQALSNLIERYGCVAGYPNGTYKGGQAMTRFEAAALLNACLDRITEVTDELKRLMKEFEKELAVLKGRVDSLEAKVGELEATQFSTTTKLKGVATFVLGANSFFGSSNLVTNPATGNQAVLGATTFNYDLRLNFDTSFTGKDLLRTTLRGGNFGGSTVSGLNGSAYGTGLSFLEAAFEQPAGENIIGVNRLFYSFPMGSELNFGAGPMVRVDDPGMLGIWPSVYPADTVLDFFTYAGAPGAYNLLALGGGAGFVYSPKGIKGLTISQNYVSAEGSAYGGTPAVNGNAGSGNPGNGGIFTTGAGSAAVTQVAYTGEKAPLIGGSYALAFAYTYSQNLPLPIATPGASAVSQESGSNVYSSANNLGLSGYWKPEKVGFVPSISWGIGSGTYNQNLTSGYSGLQQSKGTVISTWYTGLQWDDAFLKGNALGMGVGQAPYVAKAGQPGGGTPNDSNYMWEWWYKFQVTDNISITPAIYYISNYDGAAGSSAGGGTNGFGSGGAKTTSNLFGGLLKTTFKF